MKIVFLLPPSEGKNKWGEYDSESLSFDFKKPHEISMNVTQKDLKCSWTRYQEWVELNKNIFENSHDIAIKRYSWVMYNAIDYKWMWQDGKIFFEEHFLILSWMYGKLKPTDIIGNYKLPIETKGLLKYWWDTITESLNDMKLDYIVNLLPLSYMKMLKIETLEAKVVNINFLTVKNGKNTKISHWVKKIKWEWVKNICEKWFTKVEDFWWKIVVKWNISDIEIFI